jgi:hypothetical protein
LIAGPWLVATALRVSATTPTATNSAASILAATTPARPDGLTWLTSLAAPPAVLGPARLARRRRWSGGRRGRACTRRERWCPAITIPGGRRAFGHRRYRRRERRGCWGATTAALVAVRAVTLHARDRGRGGGHGLCLRPSASAGAGDVGVSLAIADAYVSWAALFCFTIGVVLILQCGRRRQWGRGRLARAARPRLRIAALAGWRARGGRGGLDGIIGGHGLGLGGVVIISGSRRRRALVSVRLLRGLRLGAASAAGVALDGLNPRESGGGLHGGGAGQLG